MPDATNSTTPAANQGGILGTLAGLFGSTKDVLDNGIKTQVTVVFPATVYFNIFALVVFCTLAVVGINLGAKALAKK